MDIDRFAYALDEGGQVIIHRVYAGNTVFSALHADSGTPACTVLDHADAVALGVDLVIGLLDRGHRFIEAIRPGLGSSDDELVAKLSSWSDGRAEWLVPVSPTPRGMVIATFLRSLHDTTTSPDGMLPRSEVSRSPQSGTDDSSALMRAFALDKDQAFASRLRSWSSGPWLLIAGQPEEHHVAHLCTVVEAGTGQAGEALLSRHGKRPQYFPRRFSAVHADEPWTSLPAELQQVMSLAAGELWDAP